MLTNFQEFVFNVENLAKLTVDIIEEVGFQRKDKNG